MDQNERTIVKINTQVTIKIKANIIISKGDSEVSQRADFMSYLNLSIQICAQTRKASDKLDSPSQHQWDRQFWYKFSLADEGKSRTEENHEVVGV